MENTGAIRLSELAGLVWQAIDRSFTQQLYWVIADVASHTSNSGRHYFDLVEKDAVGSAIIAKLPTRIWADGGEKIRVFEEMTGQRFTSGLKVLVQVSVFFHAVHGLQLSMQAIDPNFTLGAIERERKQTLLRLVSQNPDFIRLEDGAYVTFNQELALPKVIQRIAVISSAVSAGLQDFQHTLEHNEYGFAFEVDLYSTYVQGELNAQYIVDQLIVIYESRKSYDSVILIRGGGSQTDLLIFEQYSLGRAIARFPIPVITGIGHQKNETIADLMAHTAVKTPTKAAEFIIARNKAFQDELLSLEKNLIIRSQQLLAKHQRKLAQANFLLVSSATRLITAQREKLTQQQQALKTRSEILLQHRHSHLLLLGSMITDRSNSLLAGRRRQLERAAETLHVNTLRFIKGQENKLENYRAQILLMSPARLVKKGFAMIKHHGKVVKDGRGLVEGDEIEIILADQEIKAKIAQITKDENE